MAAEVQKEAEMSHTVRLLKFGFVFMFAFLALSIIGNCLAIVSLKDQKVSESHYLVTPDGDRVLVSSAEFANEQGILLDHAVGEDEDATTAAVSVQAWSQPRSAGDLALEGVTNASAFLVLLEALYEELGYDVTYVDDDSSRRQLGTFSLPLDFDFKASMSDIDRMTA